MGTAVQNNRERHGSRNDNLDKTGWETIYSTATSQEGQYLSIPPQTPPRTGEWRAYSTVPLPSSPNFLPTTVQIIPSPVAKTFYRPPETLSSVTTPTLFEAASLSAASADLKLSSHATAVSTGEPSSRGLSDGIMAVIVIASLLVAMIVIALACVWHRERKKKKGWRNTTFPLVLYDTPVLAELISPTDGMATPDPNSWLAQQQEVWNPRESSSTGFRSPTPKPAVAEVRSYTRAARKPRIYDVGRRSTPEMPGSAPESIHSRMATSSASPSSLADSLSPASGLVSPISDTLRFRPASPSARQGHFSGCRTGAPQMRRRGCMGRVRERHLDVILNRMKVGAKPVRVRGRHLNVGILSNLKHAELRSTQQNLQGYQYWSGLAEREFQGQGWKLA
ncbi:hypothetical protein B0T10DRAFT_595506 [Thelonectria olida]|uniref:Uncharacterized protein n=1 Tax=Thelonectria olida TaxID=1576542 RepID=A0A9P9AN60_9HYPO|nr:hypothetical protein B0T10DRAFT_595506 [Thelonectria olida]